MSRDLYWEQHWDDLSEVEKWERCVDKWEREKWRLLRKFLAPHQLEAVKNVDSIARRMRWGLRKELQQRDYDAGYNQSTEDEYYAD
tara:strand:+ start:616 stop:873 length:258 start_codon:yes stop_codon:yes gene_type:complete